MPRYENPIKHLTLREILPYSSYTTPIAAISKQDRVWTASAMLRFFLESSTDQIVVMENKQPCGLVGGIDIINNLLKNPSFDFCENETVGGIMHEKFLLITDATRVKSLLDEWGQSRRVFAIMQNSSYFFAISVRTLLGIYPVLDTELTIQDIPKKKIVYYSQEQSVKDVLNLMLQNKTRRLILSGSQSYISDRIIIEKIATDLSYLHNIDNFLDMSCSIFRPQQVKTIPDHTTIPKLCEAMYKMDHPYVMNNDQVFSPFDIINILGRDDVYAKNLMEMVR